MKVLLVSPKDPEVPTNLKYLMGGENTYTTTLLAYPPEGVEYTHFTDALKSGQISYTWWQNVLPWLLKLRILPLDAGYKCIKLNQDFDLIHCHVYNLKLDGKRQPSVILSDSSCNIIFLKHYIHLPSWRIRMHHLFRKKLNKFLGVYDQIWTREKAKGLIVWSEYAKKQHYKITPYGNIMVIPPGISDHLTGKQKHNNLVNILFAGVWFERKGGVVVVEAFRKLYKKYPSFHLKLIGQLPEGLKLPPNTEHKDFVPRQTALKKYYSRADIFILVPPEVEGYGLTLEEMMSYQIPAIVSNISALPERVIEGETGFIIKPNDPQELADKLEILGNNPELRKKMGKNAKNLFLEKFAIKPTRKMLKQVYENALKKNKKR